MDKESLSKIASIRDELLHIALTSSAKKAMEEEARYGAVILLDDYGYREEVKIRGVRSRQSRRILRRLERALMKEQLEFVKKFSHHINCDERHRRFWGWAKYALGVTVPNTSWHDEIASHGADTELVIRGRTYLVRWIDWS